MFVLYHNFITQATSHPPHQLTFISSLLYVKGLNMMLLGCPCPVRNVWCGKRQFNKLRTLRYDDATARKRHTNFLIQGAGIKRPKWAKVIRSIQTLGVVKDDLWWTLYQVKWLGHANAKEEGSEYSTVFSYQFFSRRTFAWGHAGMFQKFLFSLWREHEGKSSG